MSELALSVAELPRLQTEAGILTCEIEDDISHGFVLEEDGRDMSRPKLLHSRHMETARAILVEADCATDPEVILESYRAFFADSEEHVDGLTHEYYQGHTTLMDPTLAIGHQGATELELNTYHLTEEEHAFMQDMHDTLGGPGPFKPILMGNARYAGEGETLWTALGGREPDITRHTLARAQMATIVFRNGYDATPGSTAGDLYVHSGKTVDRPEGATNQRVVAISRIGSR